MRKRVSDVTECAFFHCSIPSRLLFSIRSVGNTITLHETSLVEAFNLKAAIEYQLKNYEAAQEALTDMPPRSEEELDAATLHNQALMSMDSDPAEGFEKLQFLIQQQPFPPETFANLLLLYCKYEYYDLAADVMAKNAHFTYKYLTPYLYEFLDALITQQTSPEDAYRKFDEMAVKHTDILRKLLKQLQEAKQAQNEEQIKKINCGLRGMPRTLHTRSHVRSENLLGHGMVSAGGKSFP